ncbi:hypothetical protein EHS25_001518 [Saitozyma podzolica]|uniref:Fe2OG dioxygenase domain-containing protein n=1 Tax=Saitozyma podzolica TaxID=1890683 RepID=A0A427YGX0_9TREE|nr:hypothetical protein EHS25_001518 [Saitozyma podzolica]
MSVIPTIDLAADSPERQAALIKHALSSVGFFAVQDAGPASEDIATVFRDSKTFFGLEMHEKETYLAGRSGSGYTKLLSQALGEGRRDHKETFSYGKYCANTTQPMPPPFKDSAEATETIKRFYQACHDVSERLMELFALALEVSPSDLAGIPHLLGGTSSELTSFADSRGLMSVSVCCAPMLRCDSATVRQLDDVTLPKEHFRQSHSFGLNTAMSLIHYPRLSDTERAEMNMMDIRAGEHKDWGTMTLLFQEPSGAPGLQVYLPRSAIDVSPTSQVPLPVPGTSRLEAEDTWAWYDAPVPPPGGFLVNVGLAMELWSSGAYKATLHRVIFPDEGALGDRDTLAFFVQPDDDVALHPVLPGGIVDTSQKAITSGELFDSKLQESMNRFKKETTDTPSIRA